MHWKYATPLCYPLWAKSRLPDDDPVYHARSIHLCQAKLIAHCDDYMLWWKFPSPEFRIKFQNLRKYSYFWRYLNFIITQSRTGGRKTLWNLCQNMNSIRPSISTEFWLVTDTDGQTLHRIALHFIWAMDYVQFLSSALHCFYPKLLFIVCCTAFSIHICLFTRGAILLGIESAPLSLEEDGKKGHKHN